MTNFFSSPWFLNSVGDVFYPGRRTAIETVAVCNQVYDVLTVDDRMVVDIPFLDFFEPHAPGSLSDSKGAREVAYLPAVSHGLVRAEEFLSGSKHATYLPAPCIDWGAYTRWEEFVSASQGKCSRAFGKSTRKVRKLERERGAVTFHFNRPDAELLDLCMTWKSSQLRQHRFLDVFAGPQRRALFHVLLRHGHLNVSAMFVGDEPVALILGCAWQKRYCAWIAAYAPHFNQYSPGVLLFENIMEETHAQGFKEFDFLLGGEQYKFNYATHVRLVGPLGVPALRERVWAPLRHQAVDILQRDYPTIHRGLQNVKRQAMEKRLAATQAPSIVDEELQYQTHSQRPVKMRKLPQFVDPQDCQLKIVQEMADAQTPAHRNVSLWLAKLGRRAEWIGRRRRDSIQRWLGPSEPLPIPMRPLKLQPGEWVRVKPADAIERTLHRGSCQRLYYIPSAMNPFVGGAFQVHKRVERFFDERQRRIVRIKDTVVLDKVSCDGSQLPGKQICDRSCLLFWKEQWLERVPAPASDTVASSAPGRGPPDTSRGKPAAGTLVRIKNEDSIRATLDDNSMCAGIPYAAATMKPYLGRTFRVKKRLDSFYDERRDRVLSFGNAVVLQGAYCKNAQLSRGGECDRACLLLWADAWLEDTEM